MGEFYVYTDNYVGKCYWTLRRGRVKSVFSYADSYISIGAAHNIDPAFSLTAGAQPGAYGLPGAFQDAAPDRWGRNLIAHRFQGDVRAGNERPRSLNEIDYLMGVSDRSRQGELRFSLEMDGDQLLIAKFPHHQDEWDVMGWDS